MHIGSNIPFRMNNVNSQQRWVPEMRILGLSISSLFRRGISKDYEGKNDSSLSYTIYEQTNRTITNLLAFSHCLKVVVVSVAASVQKSLTLLGR